MVTRRATRLAAVFVALSALLAFGVTAQTTPGVLKGTVVDKDGQPLPGATLSLANPSMGVKGLGGITNARGEYRIMVIQPGKGYVLTASMPSYQKIDFSNIEIPAGMTIVLNVTLRPAMVTTLRVQGKEDIINTKQPAQVTKLSSEFISGLPVLGRDYQDVLTLAPGVTDVNNSGNPNIHGARDTDVVTLVDGVSTTDPFSGQFGQQLNMESIADIEVITSGASAEFARAQGGFVNIVMKSGGNEFKGNFSFYMRTHKLDGVGAGIDNTDVRGGLGESNGFRNLAFTDLYPFLSVAGPFIKDHLWYYFAPEYSQIETPVNAGTLAFVQTTKSARITGKVDWQANSNNHVVLTTLWDDTKNFNLGLNSLTESNAAYTFERGGPTITLTDKIVISPSLSLDSTISRFDQTHSITPALNPDTNGNGILNVDKIPALGGNNDGFIQLRERDPGEDYDNDGAFDVFEDTNHNGSLDGCYTDPDTGNRMCFPPQGAVAPWATGGDKNSGCYPDPNDSSKSICPGDPGYNGAPDGIISYCPKDPNGNYIYTDPNCELPLILKGEDRDRDMKLTQKFGCEGANREDINCDGKLEFETDLNGNGVVDCPLDRNGRPKYNDPSCEDKGIPCSNPTLCPGGYELDANGNSTRGNGQFDTEDKNGNGIIDDTPFPNWVDKNHNGIPDRGEYTAPLAPDQQYVLSLNTNRRSGPFFFDNQDSRTRDSLKEDLAYYIDDFFGSHDIRTGMTWEKEGYDSNLNRRPIWQINLGAIDPNTGQFGGTIAAFLPTKETANNSAGSDNFGLYFQDYYKPLPNLTFGLGVRFDREAVHSHGYAFFDPYKQRREYDLLTNLTGEGATDSNRDGMVTQSITQDPVYQNCENCIYDGEIKPNSGSQLTSELLGLAPTRMTRHNFVGEISTPALPSGTVQLAQANGLPRAPQDFTITNNNLAPRLSVSWDPWADGKSKVSATWGRYYDKLFLQSVINEEGPDLLSPYYGYDSDGVDSNGLPDNKVGRVISKSPPSAFQIDRGLRTPFTDEFTVGFQREIAPEVSISINYIHRKFRDQLQDVDVNHTVRRGCSPTNTTPSGLCDEFGLDIVRPPNGSGGDAGKGPDQRVPDSYPDLYINNFNFNQILRIGNYNYQEYKGYELNLVRRLSRKWELNANYTFSKSTGQAESFNSESGDDPSLTELKNGYLAYDQRHVAKFAATSYLPGDWRISSTITWSSGLPFSFVNRFQSADNYDFPQTRRLYGYRDPNTGYFIEENRNIHRNHSIYRFDVHAEKNFVIGGQISAGAFIDIQNLLNTDDLRVFEIDNRTPILQALETRDFGRRFQLGIHMSF